MAAGANSLRFLLAISTATGNGSFAKRSDPISRGNKRTEKRAQET